MFCPLLTAAKAQGSYQEPEECKQEECTFWCPDTSMENGGECATTALVSKLHRIHATLDGILDSMPQVS